MRSVEGFWLTGLLPDDVFFDGWVDGGDTSLRVGRQCASGNHEECDDQMDYACH